MAGPATGVAGPGAVAHAVPSRPRPPPRGLPAVALQHHQPGKHMIDREIEFHMRSGKHMRTRRLEVFEATDLHNGVGNGRWTKVDNLKGHALFVSQDCSRSLPVANQYQDCVYFLSEHELNDRANGRKPEDDFLESGLYNIREQTPAPLPMEMKTAVVSHAGPWSLSWFFLPQN